MDTIVPPNGLFGRNGYHPESSTLTRRKALLHIVNGYGYRLNELSKISSKLVKQLKNLKLAKKVVEDRFWLAGKYVKELEKEIARGPMHLHKGQTIASWTRGRVTILNRMKRLSSKENLLKSKQNLDKLYKLIHN